jgi:hypothetical protein
LLELGRTGVHDELVGRIERGGDGVSSECGEVGEKRLQTVHRQAIRRRAVGLFGDGRGRALGLGDDAGPEGFGGGFIGVVVEHRGEALAQMPFDVIGEHAKKDVSARVAAPSNGKSAGSADRRPCYCE